MLFQITVTGASLLVYVIETVRVIMEVTVYSIHQLLTTLVIVLVLDMRGSTVLVSYNFNYYCFMLTILVCSLHCSAGYTLNSSSCECIFTSICDRDRPCKNGGNCIQHSPATNYTCDCTGTGYEGVNCTGEY